MAQIDFRFGGLADGRVLRSSPNLKPATSTYVFYANLTLQQLELLTLVCVGRVTIDALPSIALLEIFDFYLSELYASWRTLVHVCRRWRKIVFKSPCRLNLELSCSFGRPVRTALDIWPPLPINISFYKYHKRGGDVDNIVAALERKDRVCKIDLISLSSSELEKIFAVMREPFMALTSLELGCHDHEMGKVARGPDSFLGGSAPLLQTLTLKGIPIPILGLQKLILSANDLVDLRLQNIPHSAYFSPVAIATALSASTKLKTFELTFQSPRSRPVRASRRPPPPTRTLLPALTGITFKGINEYLEDVVAHIDAPLLDTLSITFFHQHIFRSPQLSRFISRAPRLKGHDEARVNFTHSIAQVTLRLPSLPNSREQEIRVSILCKHPDLQLMSMVQVCTSSIPQAFVSTVKHLYILESKVYQYEGWANDLEEWRNVQKSQWLQLLQPFIAVVDFYISEKISPLIAPALQELVGERLTEALPALECLFLDGLRGSGPVRNAIMPFVAARELSTHPIMASYWDSDKDYWWEWWHSDHDDDDMYYSID